MWNLTYATVISLTVLTTASAANQPFGYECMANDKKIIADYSLSDNDGYVLNTLTIDGQDYKANTTVSVSSGSAAFVVENYRHGKSLFLKMGVENFYRLGEDGTTYQMLCYPVQPNSHPRTNDQL